MKIVPYALGELAHWGNDLDLQPISRAYGQVGFRSSLPMWTSDNSVESQFWNVHGLAHKVVFEAEFSYAEATQSIDQFPLYDQIDDDAINQYRRNIPYWDYGAIPGQPTPLAAPFIFGPDNRYDPRSYAVRRGMASWVTGPTEIANDLTAFRVAARQRWQTKRGPIGNRRIIDWIVFDVDGEFFPVTDQNFGQVMGLWQYDFRWHAGDRTTVFSTADVDFFTGGQQLYTVGALLNRTPRGSFYLGFNQFQPLNHAKGIIGLWKEEYNTIRPHPALGYPPPERLCWTMVPHNTSDNSHTVWTKTEGRFSAKSDHNAEWTSVESLRDKLGNHRTKIGDI